MENSEVKAILGTKIGMTQIINDKGVAVPVTIIKAGPITVTQIKTSQVDGYDAIQVAYGSKKKLTKSLAGHLKSANVTPQLIREFKSTSSSESLKVGSKLDVGMFSVGDVVNVTGISKGKGFAGTVKRHNFNTSKSTHGGKGYVRRPGSIGSMYPQKVFKGKRMAGRMGHDQVTVKNLVVSYVDSENNLIGLKGAVPGPKKGIVSIGGSE